MCREFSIGYEPPNNFATLPFLLLIKETSNATESCYVPAVGKCFRNIHCNLDISPKILDAHIEEHCKYYDAILIQVLGGNFDGKSFGASHDSFKPN